MSVLTVESGHSIGKSFNSIHYKNTVSNEQ